MKKFNSVLWSLILLLCLCMGPFAKSQTSTIEEYYSERPQITNVQSRAHALGPEWESTKSAQLDYILFLFLNYPHRDLYFLARDSENLYDLAILAARAGYFNESKLHLINVSRFNSQDPLLKEYLNQEGLTEDKILGSTGVALIDTGFNGSIIERIRQLFSPEAAEKMAGHLIMSLNKNFPSSFVFLHNLKKSITRVYNLGGFKRLLLFYEEMPRYFDRSSFYKVHNGKIEAGSFKPQTYLALDGKVSKNKALLYSEDLKHYFENNNAYIRRRYNLFREVLSNLNQFSQRSYSARISYLNRLLSGPDQLTVEALLNDFYSLPTDQRVVHTDVEINSLNAFDRNAKDFRAELVEKVTFQHEELKEVFQSPAEGVHSLVVQKRWNSIETLFQIDQDFVIHGALQTEIFTNTSVPAKFQLSYINSASDEVLKYFIKNKLASLQPEVLHFILKDLVKVSPSYLSEFLVQYFFNEEKNILSYSREFLELCKVVDQNGVKMINKFILEKPGMPLQKEAFQILITKKDFNIWLTNVFTKPHAKIYLPSLAEMVRRSDSETLTRLQEVLASSVAVPVELRERLIRNVADRNLSFIQRLVSDTNGESAGPLSCEKVFK